MKKHYEEVQGVLVRIDNLDYAKVGTGRDGLPIVILQREDSHSPQVMRDIDDPDNFVHELTQLILHQQGSE